jgi:TonB family protein
MKIASSLALAISLTLGTFVRPAGAASTAACPYYVDAIGPTATANVSAIVLGSSGGDAAGVSIVLYTHTASYVLRAQVPGFREVYYSTGTYKGSNYRFPINGYLSAPIPFATPNDQPIEAAYVQPLTWDGSSPMCSAQRYIASDENAVSLVLPELQRITAMQVKLMNIAAPLTFRASEEAPACPVPYAATRVVRATEPNYPSDLDGTQAVGVSVVSVLIDEAGRVTDAAVFESSHSVALDQASIKAASASIYSGAIFRCRPEMSIYRFRAEFTRQ